MSLLLHGQTVDDYAKAGYKAEQNKNFREALNQYSKVHDLEPDNASISGRIGLMYYNLDKLDSAIIFYSKAIDKNSNDSISYYQRGHCYLDKLDFEKSLKDFEHLSISYKGEMLMQRSTLVKATLALIISLRLLNSIS